LAADAADSFTKLHRSWPDCAATDTGQHQITKLLVWPIALSQSLELLAGALKFRLDAPDAFLSVERLNAPWEELT
jgi:hypothetical protein